MADIVVQIDLLRILDANPEAGVVVNAVVAEVDLYIGAGYIFLRDLVLRIEEHLLCAGGTGTGVVNHIVLEIENLKGRMFVTCRGPV